MSSSNQDPPASDQENPSTSAEAEDISEVAQVTSPSSRSASLKHGPSSPTARSPSPGPSSSTTGPSRRNLTNEEFLINCFKAFDMKRQKIDYDKLAALCNITPKSAGNRWVSLRNKHGLKIKGFYKNQKPSADDDAA